MTGNLFNDLAMRRSRLRNSGQGAIVGLVISLILGILLLASVLVIASYAQEEAKNSAAEAEVSNLSVIIGQLQASDVLESDITPQLLVTYGLPQSDIYTSAGTVTLRSPYGGGVTVGAAPTSVQYTTSSFFLPNSNSQNPINYAIDFGVSGARIIQAYRALPGPPSPPPTSGPGQVYGSGTTSASVAYDALITMQDVPYGACMFLSSTSLSMPVSVNGSDYDLNGNPDGVAPQNCNSTPNTVSWLKLSSGNTNPSVLLHQGGPGI